MAGLMTVLRCEIRTEEKSDTTGCAVGQGCYREKTTQGYCVENHDFFGTKCKKGSQTGTGIRQKFPGNCTKNHNQDWICTNISKTAREIPFRSDCGDVNLP